MAFFQKGPTGSAAASFLQKEYGEGGKGINIAGQDYALWFHHPEKLYDSIYNLFALKKQFRAAEGFTPAKASFITEDEIDRLLTGGSQISERKLQIYTCFMQGRSAKECADYLKKSYGDGGHSYIGYDEWHGSKGIRLSRGDELSGGKYDTVTLNWTQVQKRIRGLIDSGEYLNEQEQAYLPTYEKLVLARKIYAFQYSNPNAPNRTYPHEWDAEAAGRDILPLLNDPEKTTALYADMVKALAAVSPDDRAYAQMEPALRDMRAFVRGEYSLFKPLPRAVVEEDRPSKPDDPLAAVRRAFSAKERARQKEQRQISMFDRQQGNICGGTDPDSQEPMYQEECRRLSFARQGLLQLLQSRHVSNVNETCHLALQYTRVDEHAACHGLSIRESDLEGLVYEMITTQAQIILSVDSLLDAGRLDIQFAEQAEYERQIELCMERKRVLYEQLISQEIGVEDYKKQTAEIDVDLDHWKNLRATLATQTAQAQMDEKTQSTRIELAQEVAGTDSLTLELTEKLIDRVFLRNCS